MPTISNKLNVNCFWSNQTDRPINFYLEPMHLLNRKIVLRLSCFKLKPEWAFSTVKQ